MESAAKSRRTYPLYVVTVTDGKPALWDSAAKLAKLLGPIDTPADARLWLFAKTKTWPACGVPLRACEEATEDGYALRSAEVPRCGPYERIVVTYTVSSSGQVKLTKRERIKRTPALQYFVSELEHVLDPSTANSCAASWFCH